MAIESTPIYPESKNPDPIAVDIEIINAAAGMLEEAIIAQYGVLVGGDPKYWSYFYGDIEASLQAHKWLTKLQEALSGEADG